MAILALIKWNFLIGWFFEFNFMRFLTLSNRNLSRTEIFSDFILINSFGATRKLKPYVSHMYNLIQIVLILFWFHPKISFKFSDMTLKFRPEFFYNFLDLSSNFFLNFIKILKFCKVYSKLAQILFKNLYHISLKFHLIKLLVSKTFFWILLNFYKFQ